MDDEFELIEKALNYAVSVGASYAEARFHNDFSKGFALKNGGLEGIQAGAERGMGIRVLVNGGLGFASTNILRPDSVTETVDKAVKMARASSYLRSSRIRFSREEAYSVRWEVLEKKPIENWSFSDKIDFFKSIDKTIIDLGINVASRYLAYSERVTERLYINTEGAQVASRVQRPTMFSMITVMEAPKGVIQRPLQFGGSGGMEVVESWNLVGRISNEVKVMQDILLNSGRPPEGAVDVVVDSEVSGIISHEASGHPSEADRILGREGAQAGESYIDLNDIGRRIGSECVNIVDDPTVPGSYGFFLFDDEGVKARRKFLIKEGKINELLTNRETSATLGTNSNGSARASAYNVEPIVRMSNTFILPGDYGLEELLNDVRDGVYIKSFMEWNIDDRRWNQKYVGLEAYLVENGEITKPVRNPVIEITTERLFSSIDAVGKELDFSAATCGKGDPMQGVPVYTGGPPLRIRDIRVGGA